MFIEMEEREAAGCRELEQFVLLSKTAKGAAAAELITRALEAPGVYVFGELLDSPNIKEVFTCYARDILLMLYNSYHQELIAVIINYWNYSLMVLTLIIQVIYCYHGDC